MVKKRPWYRLPAAERQSAMDEHIRVGHEFPRVKINTSYSFGLDDQEFVVAFETDYPGDCLDLVERLRRSPTYAADITSRPAEEHRPRAQTMTAFLEQVRARYGGVTRWLAGHGFGQGDLDRLHAKLRRA